MAKWYVSAAIDGTAHCTVEADSMEEAIEKSDDADWVIEEWNLNTTDRNGGHIEAQEG